MVDALTLGILLQVQTLPPRPQLWVTVAHNRESLLEFEEKGLWASGMSSKPYTKVVRHGIVVFFDREKLVAQISAGVADFFAYLVSKQKSGIEFPTLAGKDLEQLHKMFVSGKRFPDWTAQLQTPGTAVGISSRIEAEVIVDGKAKTVTFDAGPGRSQLPTSPLPSPELLQKEVKRIESTKSVGVSSSANDLCFRFSTAVNLPERSKLVVIAMEVIAEEEARIKKTEDDLMRRFALHEDALSVKDECRFEQLSKKLQDQLAKSLGTDVAKLEGGKVKINRVEPIVWCGFKNANGLTNFSGLGINVIRRRILG